MGNKSEIKLVSELSRTMYHSVLKRNVPLDKAERRRFFIQENIRTLVEYCEKTKPANEDNGDDDGPPSIDFRMAA